jgi:hypothetical protein
VDVAVDDWPGAASNRLAGFVEITQGFFERNVSIPHPHGELPGSGSDGFDVR